jgi:predicted DNA-binding protein (MmcQ/YjbR family)
MPEATSVLSRLRRICLALPDTEETLTWGQPHFRVAHKIFCGCGDEKGRTVIGFKLDRDHAHAIVEDPRFWPAPYVGHKGWVSMAAAGIRDWDEVKALVLESYGLIAPRKTLAKLEGGRAKRGTAKKGTRKTTARKPSRV